MEDPGFSDEDFREALSFTSQHVGKAVRMLLDRVRNEAEDIRLVRLVRAAAGAGLSSPWSTSMHSSMFALAVVHSYIPFSLFQIRTFLFARQARSNLLKQLEEHGLEDPGFSEADFRAALDTTVKHVGKAVRVLLERARSAAQMPESALRAFL